MTEEERRKKLLAMVGMIVAKETAAVELLEEHNLEAGIELVREANAVRRELLNFIEESDG